jgi:hypothetical protein
LIRLLLRLLGIKDYEVCQSCETLKSQLVIANEDRQRLTDTLIQILKPSVSEAPPVEINQIATTAALFSRRRAALEAKDREEAKILKSSKNLGRPDFATDDITTERLEHELGISEAEKEG